MAGCSQGRYSSKSTASVVMFGLSRSHPELSSSSHADNVLHLAKSGCIAQNNF